MRTTSSSFRRGTSSIMGTLIFVGIIFTAFIPMLLVMRQADNLHEINKHELGILDQERAGEEINFYAYPDDQDELILRIKNEGSAPIKIVNVWINDEEYHQEVNIKSMETINLDSLPVILQDLTSYTVKVITEKGNSFTSLSGTLYYSGDKWYTPSLGICVHILNIKGKYEITVTIETESMETVTVGYYISKDMEWGDLIKIFMVDYPDDYTVTIKKPDGSNWINLGDSPKEVSIVWPPEILDNYGPITTIYVIGESYI